MYKHQLIAQHKLDNSTTRLSTETPGPGSYKLPSTLNLNAGRKIGKSSAASYIDVVVNRASKIPAPGQCEWIFLFHGLLLLLLLLLLL
jgi:hypothetical protein